MTFPGGAKNCGPRADRKVVSASEPPPEALTYNPAPGESCEGKLMTDEATDQNPNRPRHALRLSSAAAPAGAADAMEPASVILARHAAAGDNAADDEHRPPVGQARRGRS
jgi:hypothetical protein